MPLACLSSPLYVLGLQLFRMRDVPRTLKIFFTCTILMPISAILESGWDGSLHEKDLGEIRFARAVTSIKGS